MPTAATTSCRTATPGISPPIFPTPGRLVPGCSMSGLASSTSTWLRRPPTPRRFRWGRSTTCGTTRSTCPTAPGRTAMRTFSGGANYEFSDNMSAYVRVNNGVHFQNFDDVRCNNTGCPNKTPLETMQNYEVGFKIQNQWMYLDASAYYKIFNGLAYTPVNIDNVPIGATATYGSDSKGGRIVGTVAPLATSDNQLLSTFKITV